MEPLSKPIQLSVPIPHGLSDARIHAHITICGGKASSKVDSRQPKRGLLVFLASSSGSSSTTPAALGNLVCAFPDLNPSTEKEERKLPHSTFLTGSTVGMDFNLSVARALAGRLNRPIHLGSSLRLEELSGNGGDVMEQIGAINLIITMIIRAVAAVEAKYASISQTEPTKETQPESSKVDDLASATGQLQV